MQAEPVELACIGQPVDRREDDSSPIELFKALSQLIDFKFVLQP
jgi:hypothetical protein